jgi:condensin complex subunit 1
LDICDVDWDEERERAVKALVQLMQLNVQRLWDPPIAEEEFVR